VLPVDCVFKGKAEFPKTYWDNEENEEDDGNLRRGRIAATVIMTVFGFFAISAIVYFGLIFLRSHKPEHRSICW
jgi:hypothetical protein